MPRRISKEMTLIAAADAYLDPVAGTVTISYANNPDGSIPTVPPYNAAGVTLRVLTGSGSPFAGATNTAVLDGTSTVVSSTSPANGPSKYNATNSALKDFSSRWSDWTVQQWATPNPGSFTISKADRYSGTDTAAAAGFATPPANFGLDAALIKKGDVLYVFQALHDDILQVQVPGKWVAQNLNGISVVNCFVGGPGAENAQQLATSVNGAWRNEADNVLTYAANSGNFSFSASPTASSAAFTPKAGDIISFDGSTTFATVASWSSTANNNVGSGSLTYTTNGSGPSATTGTWTYLRGGVALATGSGTGLSLTYAAPTFSLAYGLGFSAGVGDTISFAGLNGAVESVTTAVAGTFQISGTGYTLAAGETLTFSNGATATVGSSPGTTSGSFTATAGSVIAPNMPFTMNSGAVTGTVLTVTSGCAGTISYSGTLPASIIPIGKFTYTQSSANGGQVYTSDYLYITINSDQTFTLSRAPSSLKNFLASAYVNNLAFNTQDALLLGYYTSETNYGIQVFIDKINADGMSGTLKWSKQYGTGTYPSIPIGTTNFYHGRSWVNSQFINYTASPGLWMGYGANFYQAGQLRNHIHIRTTLVPQINPQVSISILDMPHLSYYTGSGSGNTIVNATLLNCAQFDCVWPGVSFYTENLVVDDYMINPTFLYDYTLNNLAAPLTATKDMVNRMLAGVNSVWGAPASAANNPKLITAAGSGITFDATGHPPAGSLSLLPANVNDPYPVYGDNTPRISGSAPVGSMPFAA